MGDKKKIAFFVGSDITAQLVLNGVIKDVYENRNKDESRYETVVFLPSHPGSIKADLPELKEFSFYERGILNDVVFPYVDQNVNIGARNFSPDKLSEKYGFKLERVPDVNSPEFIESLSQHGVFAGAFSIRCFQIFQQPIIDHFNQKSGFFLNAHPGILPKFRGVMSTVRTMFEDVVDPPQRYGWTLHEVDRGIDTGDVLWVRARTDIDKSKAAVLVNTDLAPLGINTIKSAFDNLDQNEVLAGHPQDHKKGIYHTYPTRKELREWKDHGITLVDREGMTKKLVEEFSVVGTEHANQLALRIHNAIDKFEDHNKPRTPVIVSSSNQDANGTPVAQKKGKSPKKTAFTNLLHGGGGLSDPSLA